jgi:hypothetical protein
MNIKDRITAKATNMVIKKIGIQGFLNEYSKMGEKYDVESGKKYKTAEEEVAHFVQVVPLLKPVEKNLVQLTRNYRIAKGLSA